MNDRTLRMLVVCLVFVAGCRVASAVFRQSYDRFRAEVDKLSVRAYYLQGEIDELQKMMESSKEKATDNADLLDRKREELSGLREAMVRARERRIDLDFFYDQSQKIAQIVSPIAIILTSIVVIRGTVQSSDPREKAGLYVLLGLIFAAFWL